MKSLKSILPLLVIAIITQSCYKRNHWGITGKGENVKETKSISGFNKVHLAIDADVDFVQDSVFMVQIEGQANIISVIRFDVSAGELKIATDRNLWKHKRITITIHAPSVAGLTLSGSGNISTGKLAGTSLDLKISGSGNISIPEISGQSLSANISGSGNIRLSGGIVKSGVFTISGSGNIDAIQLKTISNVSKISGSGNISVEVSESINVNISGSGDFTYRGPATVVSQISGSGRVIHIN